jgi:hypothetical protein
MTLILQIALGMLLGYLLIVHFSTVMKYGGFLLLLAVAAVAGLIFQDEIEWVTGGVLFMVLVVVGVLASVFVLGLILEYTPYLNRYSSKHIKKWPDYSGSVKDYVGDRMSNGVKLLLILFVVYLVGALAMMLTAYLL